MQNPVINIIQKSKILSFTFFELVNALRMNHIKAFAYTSDDKFEDEFFDDMNRDKSNVIAFYLAKKKECKPNFFEPKNAVGG